MLRNQFLWEKKFNFFFFINYDIMGVVKKMNDDKFQFKKSYGQNFLKDPSIVEKIAESVEMKEDSLVIEIGPGSGMLTRPLAERAKQVLSYEIDQRLEEILDRNLLGYKNVTIIYDDFLKRNVKKDLEEFQYQNLYVAANLPYYITTPIIMKLIHEQLDISRIVIMIQKEVGERFSAKVGTRDYNSLTVFLNYYFEVKKLFVVSRHSFIPKPHVDSIVVSLTKRTEIPKVKDLDLFFQIVRESFRFKRKNLRNNLKHYDLEKIAEVLARHNLDLTVRAENLPLEVFIEISDNLAK